MTSNTTPSKDQLRLSFAERIGMHPELVVGYIGLLLFMIGDGVEAGFLSPLLVDMHFTSPQVAAVFTGYGITAALASWLSGALSDIFGPKKVMWVGLLFWVVFEIPFLTFGIARANYFVILLSYAVRGFGYPLFAYSFLVWITEVTPERYMGRAVGWFWSARTGGLPTLGALLASFTVPRAGAYATLWISVSMVVAGGLIALFGVREKHGLVPLARNGHHPIRLLLSSVSIVWRHPKVGLGGIVATITTTSEFGFLVFLPIFFTRVIGFTLEQWLQILSIMFATNVVANLIWGWVGDRIGWRRTITYIGSCGCAVTTLGLFYVPHAFGADYALAVAAGMAYGTALAGFVPIGAIMATLAPESRGAAMSIMNLGSGMSTFIGPALAGIFLPLLGVSGVIWIFACLYLIAAGISYTLRLPGVHALR
ncbi:MAG TPA: MFS transporter [Terracidiphilus sp.]|nr:MFS transporter [Terracidiphilus sp.]